MKLKFEDYAKMCFGKRYTAVEDRLDDLAEILRECRMDERTECEIWRAFADLENAIEAYKDLLKDETREYLILRKGLEMVSTKIYEKEKNICSEK